MLAFEKKKAETMMSAVNKFASLLMRKKSPAELSKSRWKDVAKLYRAEKLTLEAWRYIEEGGDPSTFGQPTKKVSWCSANIRAQFEPQYNEFSKVSSIPGDKACVATRINASDAYVACAYFDGCITVFDIEEMTVFNTQDMGCLKQFPSGDWRMTEQDDD